MTFLISTIKILSGIAIFQSILISFFLFTQKRGSSLRKNILAVLLLSFALFVSGTVMLLYFGDTAVNRHWGHLLNLSIFLTAPLLYFYFNSYVSNSSFDLKKDGLHLIPFALIFLIMFYQMVINQQSKFVFEPYGISLISILIVQNIIYLYLILKKYNSGSDKRDKKINNLKWLNFILRSFIVLLVFKLVIFVVWNILEQNLVCIFFTNIFFVLSFLVVNTLILIGLNKPEMLIGQEKYQKSTINEDSKKKYLDILKDKMTNEELFIDPLVSLDKIAKATKIPSKHLSQIINENYQFNFNDYINSLRIRKATELLNTQSDKNILEIAYEVGFNSKTTFNAAFKKFIGKTPSEFRK